MSDNSTPRATGEAVAWAVMLPNGKPITFAASREGVSYWERTSSLAIVPLYAHPSAAAVTNEMVEAAAKAPFLDDTISHGMTWDDASPRLVKEFKAYARVALAAALTAASEGASA